MSPSATPATQNARPCRQVPRLPRKVTVDVAKCHACHANRGGVHGAIQALHQSQPSPISATPATQNARPCRQVPCLPRKVTVDVAKCYACHANRGGVHGANWDPSAPPEPAQSDKYHARHAECTSMSPSATPATQSEGGRHQVPVSCVSNLCVMKLSVRKLYVDKLCVDKLKLCE